MFLPVQEHEEQPSVLQDHVMQSRVSLGPGTRALLHKLRSRSDAFSGSVSHGARRPKTPGGQKGEAKFVFISNSVAWKSTSRPSLKTRTGPMSDSTCVVRLIKSAKAHGEFHFTNTAGCQKTSRGLKSVIITRKTH